MCLSTLKLIPSTTGTQADNYINKTNRNKMQTSEQLTSNILLHLSSPNYRLHSHTITCTMALSSQGLWICLRLICMGFAACKEAQGKALLWALSFFQSMIIWSFHQEPGKLAHFRLQYQGLQTQLTSNSVKK